MSRDCKKDILRFAAAAASEVSGRQTELVYRQAKGGAFFTLPADVK